MIVSYPSLTQIGTIIKPFGTKGQVLISFGLKWERNLGKLKTVFIERNGKPVPFFVSEIAKHNQQTAIAKLEWVDSIDDAELISNCQLMAERPKLSHEAKPDWFELEGYMAQTPEKKLGKITKVEQSGGQWLMQIGNFLIPAVDDWLLAIDEKNETVTFDLPEGLLNL